MRRLSLAGLAFMMVTGLAACVTRGLPALTPTASVVAQPSTPLPTAAPPTETAAATVASTATAQLSATAAAVTATTEPDLSAASSDPLLRTYRSMVAIQVNAALVAETVKQVQAGRIDQEEMPVAALALGALTQSVDEGLPGITPPPVLAAQWQAAAARHEEVKALGARWLIGQVDVGEVSAAMETIQADLQRLLAEADAAVAAQYGVKALELTEHRERLVQAVGGVFE